MNDVLVKPVITEKSLSEAAKGRYTFAVQKGANKAFIAAVISQTFGVKPTVIKTAVVKGEYKRTGKLRLLTKESSWKKAIVSLAKGQKIELFDTGSQEPVDHVHNA